jgi:hypothetical protein
MIFSGIGRNVNSRVPESLESGGRHFSGGKWAAWT